MTVLIMHLCVGLPSWTFRVVFFFWAAIVLITCSPSRDTATDGILEIVEMTMLPDLSLTKYVRDEKPRALIRVLPDGRVDEVKIVNPSGNPDWDVAVMDSIKKWRFAYLPPNSQPGGEVFRISLDIKPLYESVIFFIGEFRTSDIEISKLLYEEIKEAPDIFEVIQRIQYTPDQNIEFIFRSTDLANYPENIRRIVKRMRYDEFSNPVRLGDHYIIYMRFREKDTDHLISIMDLL